MKLLRKLQRLFTSAGLEEADYRRIRLEMWEANRRSVCTFSAVGLVLFSVMAVLGFLLTPLRRMRVLYLLCAAACMGIFALSKGSARQNARLTGVAMYGFILLLQMFGVLAGTLYTPNELAVSYIALLLATPQVFTDRPKRMCMVVAGSFAIFVVMCLLVKDRSVWRTDMINAAVFGLLSMFSCAYLMKLKLERYIFEDDTRILAETDQLTGVLNRYRYELELRKAPDLDMKTFSAVYVDVNGLHEINNLQGHAAGDDMLCAVARIMQSVFGRENTYRIGGDEFVALGTNLTENGVQARVEQLREQVAAVGYQVAVGIGFRPREALDVTALIREAEQQMYRNKDVYYRETGIDRARKS